MPVSNTPTDLFAPGNLVSYHGRTWLVMPSHNEDLLTLRPLGGAELETRTLWKPAHGDQWAEGIRPYDFPAPTQDQIGDFASARLLNNAARLLFRNGAGPFRSAGKISVRPKAFQIVPLIMALRQPVVRLMIADDVGVGKTIEALLIAREMLDRGIIRRVGVLCPPHLCEQWQTEMLDKFGLDAVVIRSGTLGALERQCAADETIFERFDLQIISLDLVKTDRYRPPFLKNLPDLIIVDEVHTCTRPGGKDSRQQQLRHELLSRIAAIPTQHLLLLTATPHSGKPDEFQSIIGLLHSDFEQLDLPTATPMQRKTFAHHFVQRRRAHIEHWMGEDTPFPKREASELGYTLSPEYKAVFLKTLAFARQLAGTKAANEGMQKLRYYAALTLLRGVMSAPRTGGVMLMRRAAKSRTDIPDEAIDAAREQTLETNIGVEDDTTPTDIVAAMQLDASEQNTLQTLADELKALEGMKSDRKVTALKQWLEERIERDISTIVFCRFIDTAKYLGEVVGPVLEKKFGKKDFTTATITGELPDDVRKDKILDLAAFKSKVVFATDCMSEGINLQEQFSAVVHYDLPWNPNRLEQREGRVDRMGQLATKVEALIIVASDNPMDGVVLKVLIRKAQKIRETTGISIPLPEDSATITEAILQAVLLNPNFRPDQGIQMTLFDDDPVIIGAENTIGQRLEESKALGNALSQLLAQHALRPEELEEDLRSTDEAIGRPENVQEFVTEAVEKLGGTARAFQSGHRLQVSNLPSILWNELTDAETADVSFLSPVPAGLRYLGRNHPFVEQLCHEVLNRALGESGNGQIGRVSAIFSTDVIQPTTLYLLRIRSRIEDGTAHNRQLAEEMLLWGFRGSAAQPDILEEQAAKQLLYATATGSLPDERRARLLELALKDYETLRPTVVEQLALQRAELLVQAHERYRKAVGGSAFQVVRPVLPPDLLGVFMLIPETPQL
jgi:superfamily II DNA or RNA helicase